MFCGNKEQDTIIMKKVNIIVLFTLIIVITCISESKIKSVRTKIPAIIREQIRIISLNISWENKSKIFMVMVLLVTTLVTIIRESYIEHYNNKKYINILLGFLISIITLATRGRQINVITGWEALGLSSLLLIIFYPNKTGKVNSIITIFFNRLGDVAVIFITGKIIVERIELVSGMEIRKPILRLMIMCALTKRAQFPMSAWLPAAIAAPTPISAIVHSSTLVTAGIYLIITYHQQIIERNKIEVIIIIRIVRFIMGGVIANTELDFKKIVAFSTMSQIRIIIFFTCSWTICVAFSHIVYHALFKTLLFTIAGIIFIKAAGSQLSSKIRLEKKEKILINMAVVRIFSMSGLVWSSSFYSKDLFLENQIIEQKGATIIIFILSARLTTIIYCINMLAVMINKNKNSTRNRKLIRSKEIVIFTLLVRVIPLITKITFSKIIIPIIRKEEAIILFVILILYPVLVIYGKNKIKRILKLTFSVSYTKYSMYSAAYKSQKIIIIIESDLITIKKTLIVPERKVKMKSIFSLIIIIALSLAVIK